MNKPDIIHKTVLRKVILTIGILTIVFMGIVVAILLTQKPKSLHISNVDLASLTDGVYTGSADNGLVKATVSVDVKDGKILNITILEHENMLGKKAEKITESIISEQSLEVDAVTSATYSSDTLRKAVENALTKEDER